MDNSENVYKINIQLPFESKRIAEIAYDVLSVDAEPKRSRVSKTLLVKDNILYAEFSAGLARQLRVAVNGYLEKVDLITETIKKFGGPISDSYSHY